MDQLQGAGASTFFLLAGLELLDVRRMNILEPHLAHHCHNVTPCNLLVLENSSGIADQFLAIELDFDESLQVDLRTFINQPHFDLGQRLPDPIPTFLLGFAILGQAPAFEADLGTPAASSKRPILLKA